MKQRTRTQLLGAASVLALVTAGVMSGCTPKEPQTVQGDTSAPSTPAETKTTPSPDNAPAPPKKKPTSDKPVSHKTMVKDVRAGKYDMKCTFQKGKVSGVLYIHKNEMRSESQTPKGKGYTIVRGHKAWTWMAGKSQGVLFTDVGKSAKTKKYSLEEYEKNKEKYNLKCQKVDHLDASLFKVPQNVTFQDMSKMVGKFRK